jgi:LuxR family transcriptional regulator of csgAB operon
MSDHCVYIVSRSDFQKKLLASYVHDKTKMFCQSLEADDWHEIVGNANAGKKIVLWDCLNIDCERLDDRLIRLLNTFPDQCMVSLFNVNASFTDGSIFISKWLYGVFYENDSPEHLVKGIKAIIQGEMWFPRGIMAKFILANKPHMRGDSSDPPSLTSREKEILVQITSGFGNKEIAEKLCVSQYTIKTHLYNIFKKINVSTRVQASSWASRNNHFLI